MDILEVPKIRAAGSFYLRAIRFRKSKTQNAEFWTTF